MYLSAMLYTLDGYDKKYSRKTFDDRLYQLRGWTDGKREYPAVVHEGQHWTRVGRAIVWTEEGREAIRAALLGEGKSS